jgi:hypothetical protein
VIREVANAASRHRVRTGSECDRLCGAEVGLRADRWKLSACGEATTPPGVHRNVNRHAGACATLLESVQDVHRRARTFESGGAARNLSHQVFTRVVNTARRGRAPRPIVMITP